MLSSVRSLASMVASLCMQAASSEVPALFPTLHAIADPIERQPDERGRHADGHQSACILNSFILRELKFIMYSIWLVCMCKLRIRVKTRFL